MRKKKKKNWFKIVKLKQRKKGMKNRKENGKFE